MIPLSKSFYGTYCTIEAFFSQTHVRILPAGILSANGYLRLDLDDVACMDPIVEFFSVSRRHIDAAVRTAVLINRTAEGASPIGIVQPVPIAAERHPISDERIILGLAVIFQPFQMLVSLFVQEMECAGRSTMVLLPVDLAGDDRCLEDQFPLFVVVKGLLADINNDTRFCLARRSWIGI